MILLAQGTEPLFECCLADWTPCSDLTPTTTHPDWTEVGVRPSECSTDSGRRLWPTSAGN